MKAKLQQSVDILLDKIRYLLIFSYFSLTCTTARCTTKVNLAEHLFSAKPLLPIIHLTCFRDNLHYIMDIPYLFYSFSVSAVYFI